ncbi:histidine phosphatase family protein [Oscillatoria sp. FACHB-1406]|uniref:histidine phosphatase family protein n=1 Tax=Oscillatoria sp. FACHB-1406 TaxID=2692846 RepID=UPI001683F1B7|nr:histidine phosphatase family protein [Oscillatoria sp. FACHB-1406]MBD2580078.1 histidine phosphatase family protein [Oscillatoria sp. FACHB-1406]
MTLNLYFLRHGETESSLTGTYCGALDVELSAEGRQMAEDFKAAYQSFPWEAVYVSPMLRTVATAKPLCDAMGLKMQLREGLREIAYGDWEGKTPAEVETSDRDNYIRWLSDPGWNGPTGGEKGIDIARRSALVLEEIEQKYQTGNVLIVSHKATIRIMLCELLGIDVGRFRDRIGMLVASISVVEIGARGPLLKILGDRAHLRASLRDRPGS